RRTGNWVRGISRSRAKNRNQCIGDDAGVVVVSEDRYDAGNLRIDRRVKDSVTSADHRFVIVERIPGERDARPEVGSRRVQRAVLPVVLIAQAVVEGKRTLDSPGILPKHGGERSRLLVTGVPETLLVERRQSLTPGLQSADAGKIHA